MTGPTKFMPPFSAHVLTLVAAAAAWHLGRGQPSTTLLWFGAMGWVINALVFQSEWPRQPDGSLVSLDEIHQHPAPKRGPLRLLLNNICWTSIVLALPLGLVASCVGL